RNDERIVGAHRQRAPGNIRPERVLPEFLDAVHHREVPFPAVLGARLFTDFLTPCIIATVLSAWFPQTPSRNSLSSPETAVRIPDASSGVPKPLPLLLRLLPAAPSSTLRPWRYVQTEHPFACSWSKTTDVPAPSPVCASHRPRCAAPRSQSVPHPPGVPGTTPLGSVRVPYPPACLRSAAARTLAGFAASRATRPHCRPTTRTGPYLPRLTAPRIDPA